MNDNSLWQLTFINTATKLYVHYIVSAECTQTRQVTTDNTFSHKSFSLSSFQMFPILSSTPSVKDWSAVSLKSELGTGPIYRELAAQLETFQDELSTVAETGQKRTDSLSSIANKKTTDIGSQRVDNSSVSLHVTVSKTATDSIAHTCIFILELLDAFLCFIAGFVRGNLSHRYNLFSHVWLLTVQSQYSNWLRAMATWPNG